MLPRFATGGTGDELRLQILPRLRTSALVGLTAITIGAVVNTLTFSDRLGERLVTFAVEAALCLAVVLIARTRWAAAHAVAIAVAFISCMGAAMLWAISLSPQDLDVLVGVVAAMMVGSALVVPWGVRTQAVVSLFLASGYAFLMPWPAPDPSRAVNIGIVLGTGIILSLAGAFILDLQRRRNALLVRDLERLGRQTSLILDSAGEGIYGLDLAGAVSFANRAAARLLGTTPEALLGKHQREVEEGAGDASPPIDGVFERVFRKRDGTLFPVECTMTALREGDQLLGTVVTFSDSTERNLARAAREEEARITEALARVGRDLISSLDRPVILERLCRLTTEVLECDASHTLLRDPEDGTWSVISSYGESHETVEFLRLLKLPDDVMRQLLAQFPTGEMLQRAVSGGPDSPLGILVKQHLGYTVMLHIALRRGDEITGLQIACRRADRPPFASQHERIARGIARLASMALDNVRLVDELERVSTLKSEFVATMSHELRTPLNIITGYNELLLDGTFGPLGTEQAGILRRVDANSRQLLDLINATLDLSRLEAGKLPVDLGDVSLSTVIAELGIETCDIRDKSGVGFAVQLDPALPSLHTDRVKLKMLLKNLIVNAFKFTDHGVVRVEARRVDAGSVEIAVIDTGIGIESESLSMIFDQFRQADGSSSRGYGGLGLGLYIVRRLLDPLRGSITVDSALGEGSAFRVRLPIRLAEPVPVDGIATAAGAAETGAGEARPQLVRPGRAA